MTGADGYLTASYRYNAYGEMTFGKTQYENVYGYNGESYNPNLDGQYLRARYYHVEAANFFTEDSYLGNIREPLSLNRYNYVYSSYLNYIDPSGQFTIGPVVTPREFLEDNIESLQPKLSEAHLEINKYAEELSQGISKEDARKAIWSFSEFLKYKKLGSISSSGREYKNSHALNFIRIYKQVILKASEIFDIPPMLLSGVAFQEYGGTPNIIDPLAYQFRSIVQNNQFLRKTLDGLTESGSSFSTKVRKALLKDTDKTSFGNLSMQVRVAEETLGYSQECSTAAIKSEIIQSLKDPVENLLIAAKHLSFLKNIDFSGVKSENMSEQDISITATRYNVGPDLEFDAIQNNSYGREILNQWDRIQEAIDEEHTNMD